MVCNQIKCFQFRLTNRTSFYFARNISHTGKNGKNGKNIKLIFFCLLRSFGTILGRSFRVLFKKERDRERRRKRERMKTELKRERERERESERE